MKRHYRAIIEVSGTIEDDDMFEGGSRFLQGVNIGATSSVTDLKVKPLRAYEVASLSDDLHQETLNKPFEEMAEAVRADIVREGVEAQVV